MIQDNEIPVIEPAKGGYWAIYDDGRKIWHKDEYSSNYKPNWEDDVKFPEPDESYEFPQDETDLINQELSVASHEADMKIKPPSDYVIAKLDVKDGEYITILNEGEYVKLPNSDREVLTFKVKLPSGDEKKMSMNATSQKELILAWTDDSKLWIGKKCLVNVVKQNVRGQFKDVMYLHPEGGVPAVPEEKIPDETEPLPKE